MGTAPASGRKTRPAPTSPDQSLQSKAVIPSGSVKAERGEDTAGHWDLVERARRDSGRNRLRDSTAGPGRQQAPTHRLQPFTRKTQPPQKLRHSGFQRGWKDAPGAFMALAVENLPASAGDMRDLGSIPGWGRAPGRGHGNPLRCSCLESAMDRAAWRAAVYGITKSRTRLEQLSMHTVLSQLETRSQSLASQPQRAGCSHVGR